ncbi:MAG TPA: cupin domain-containing protein [Terriglobales bacterium]|nr:cupin domain-containing protein [Terriglobales bacterium]
MNAPLTAADVIRLLKLQPLPIEGGYFRETYRSADSLEAPRYGSPRSFASAIYFLLTPDSFSSLHRLRTDEVYHFYLGDPAELLLLHGDGKSERVLLGHDLSAGHQAQYVVPRGVWQGSRVLPGGGFSLLGTTMAPGFDPRDFEHGTRRELLGAYPAQPELIRSLTRE